MEFSTHIRHFVLKRLGNIISFDILNIDVDIDSFVNDRQNLCNCIHNKILDWFECFSILNAHLE